MSDDLKERIFKQICMPLFYSDISDIDKAYDELINLCDEHDKGCDEIKHGEIWEKFEYHSPEYLVEMMDSLAEEIYQFYMNELKADIILEIKKDENNINTNDTSSK